MSYQDFEPSDIDARLVAGIVAALLLLLIVSLAVIFLLFTGPGGERRLSVLPLGVERGVPGPRLQADPSRDWEQLLAIKQQLLQSYAWVDEQRDIARIPITAAMALYGQGRWQAMADQEGLPGLRARLRQWEGLYGGWEIQETETPPRRPVSGRQSRGDTDALAEPRQPARETLGQRLERLRGGEGVP